jgi:putative endopeptidase
MNRLRLTVRVAGLGAAVILVLSALAQRLPAASLAPPGIAASGIDPADMDRTCKPCDDFAQFANGGFLKRHPIPAAFPMWGVNNIATEDNREQLHRILETAKAGPAPDAGAAAGSNERKIGAYYGSCMDEHRADAAALEPLQAQLTAIQGIPTVQQIGPIAAQLAVVGVDAGWSLDSESDLKDSSKTIAGVSPSGLGLPDRDYYLQNDPRSKAIRQKYLAYVATVLRAGGLDAAPARSEAAGILALETVLAKATPPRAELRDPQKTYHPMSVGDLQRLAPTIDWKAYAYDLGAPPFETLDVSLPDYMKALDQRLVATPLATWKAYLTFRTIDAYAPTLTKALIDARFDFYSRTLEGVTAQQPRYKRCVAAVDHALGEALGAVYVAKYFPPPAKARARALVDNLQAVLHDDIAKLDWMSPVTKARAETKLAALTKKIGYPDHFRDYSGLSVGDVAYATNALAANRFQKAYGLAKIGKPTDRAEWFMSPPTNNAYYDPSNNEIVFPAGILRPPYFSAAFDDAVNYGSIGATIGHEMTHGFDDQGRQYDEKGNINDWWTPADAKRFNARAQCIVDQFDGYVVAPGAHENGKLVQGEAIADLGGLIIALRAFERTAEYKAHKPIGGYTPEQRFFIAYAQSWAGARREAFARQMVKVDPHPDERFRIIGTLANVPEFRTAFACPIASKMVRPHACAVW